MIKFLLIAPKAETGSDFAGIAPSWGGQSLARIAPAGIATVAALAPDGIECVLHDEALDAINFDAEADFIGISANVSQARRAVELAHAFRQRGKPVIIGGPHITLDPDFFAGSHDVSVSGEFEETAPAFYADMIADTLKPHYAGGRPDLSLSPVPAWQLYDNDRALVGVAQTSRGCPFECNFCDVIQYLGRVQRHKNPEQVVAEVQQLYDLGYNRIALADDNLTVYRRRVKSLLAALADWNGRDGRDYVNFATQVSLDLTESPELLELCAQAGVLNLFFGIETPNEESLKEANKRQNLGRNVAERLRAVTSYGIRPDGGLIVGFDADGMDIFSRQFEFVQTLPVGTFLISALNAPISTPLHDEMLAAGRIANDTGMQSATAYLNTNIIPAQMTKNELSLGTRWLISKVFSPAAFSERVELAARSLGPNPLRARARPYNPPQRRNANRMFARMLKALMDRDPGVAEAVAHCRSLMRANPDIDDGILDIMSGWLLTLHTHVERGAYDSEWARLDHPPFELAHTSKIHAV